MEKKPDFEKLSREATLEYWNTDRTFSEIHKKKLESFWTDYVTPLQSQLSEAEKRIKELEEISADDDHAILILEDQLKQSQSENERLLSALKELQAFCIQEVAITQNQLQIFQRDKNRDMKARCESSIRTYEKILEKLDLPKQLINDSGER